MKNGRSTAKKMKVEQVHRHATGESQHNNGTKGHAETEGSEAVVAAAEPERAKQNRVVSSERAIVAEATVAGTLMEAPRARKNRKKQETNAETGRERGRVPARTADTNT